VIFKGVPVGVFARATRLSVSALRTYDRLGLLSPVTDGRYTVEQFPRAGLIRRLRELEVPLPEIADMLAADTPEQARDTMERHLARIAARAARLGEIAGSLHTFLDEDPVYLRRRPPQHTARLIVNAPLRELAGASEEGFADLFHTLDEQSVEPSGPTGSRFLSDGLDDPTLTVELFVPVQRSVRPAGRTVPGRLPAAVLAATLHHGRHDTVERAYRGLGRWVAAHGHDLAGPAEELYVVPQGTDESLRTEVAWPVS
jgi:DNA-binding transcriptional MerR regulator/effector-binding domain-containing protein